MIREVGTARSMLLACGYVGLMCGIVVTSMNVWRARMSEYPEDIDPWLIHQDLVHHIESLTWSVALCGIGLLVLGLSLAVFVRARE